MPREPLITLLILNLVIVSISQKKGNIVRDWEIFYLNISFAMIFLAITFKLYQYFLIVIILFLIFNTSLKIQHFQYAVIYL